MTMVKFRKLTIYLLLGMAAGLLTGCAMTTKRDSTPAEAGSVSRQDSERLVLPSSDATGGEVRCTKDRQCYWAVIEHELNNLALYKFEGRNAHLVDKAKLAYHPEGVAWLNDNTVVAAVEGTGSLDVFNVSVTGQLKLTEQVQLGFAPMDVTVVSEEMGKALLVATPYSGEQVAWVELQPGTQPKVHKQKWCQTPWHVRLVPELPGKPGVQGLVTSCRGDKKVVYLPAPSSLDEARVVQPTTLITLPYIAREVSPSPSGRYWYAALELGGKVGRFNVAESRWSWFSFPEVGSVGVAPLSDEIVAFGEDRKVYVRKYDLQENLVIEKVYPTSGMPTGLQWVDIDGDGLKDLAINNTAGKGVDVHFILHPF